MAQRVVTLLLDDVTGKEGDDVTNVKFSFAGSDYEIDLNDENYAKFQKVMAPYMENGRRIPRSRGTSRSAGSSTAKPRRGEDSAKIREWAKKQGYDVSARGRVPASIREAYDAAN